MLTVVTHLVYRLLWTLSRLFVDYDEGQQHIVFHQDRSVPCKDHGIDISHNHQNPQIVPHHKDTVADGIPMWQLGICFHQVSLDQNLHQSH
jgi:hypothetical protein